MAVTTEKAQLDIVINGNKAQKELGQLEQQARELRQEIKQLNKEDANYANQKKTLNAELAKNVARQKELRKEIGLNGLTMRQLNQEASRLRLVLNNLTPGTPEWKKYNNELKKVVARQKEVRQQTAHVDNSFRGLAGRFNHYIGMFTAIAATFTGIAFSMSKLISGNAELSDSLTDVEKTTGLTSEQVRSLYDELKKLDTRSSRQELLELARIAGKLGVTGEQNVLGFVRAADQLNVALSEDLGGNAEESIRQVGKLVDIFKVKDQFGLEQGMLKVGSAINSLGAASTASEEYLVEFSKRLGGIAPVAGISVDQVLGLGATLDQLGQTAEISSTVFSQIVPNMFKDTGLYAEIAGMNVGEFSELLNKDANEALIKVLEGLNSNNAGLGQMALKLEEMNLKGKRSISVLGVLAQNTELLRNQQQLSNQEFIKGTSLTEEFNKKNENFAGNLAKIGKAIAGKFVNSGLVKFLERVAGGIADWVDKSETQQQQLERTRLEMDKELEVLKRGNFTQEQRAKIIKGINEKYGEYLPNLLSEKATIQDIEKAQKGANEQILAKILLMDYEEEKKKILDDQVKAEKTRFEIEKKRTEMQMETNFVSAKQTEMQSKQLETLDDFSKTVSDSTTERLEEVEDKYSKLAERLGKDFESLKASLSSILDTDVETTGGEPDIITSKEELKTRQKINERIVELYKELAAYQMSENQKEIQAINDKYDKEIEAAKGYTQSIKELEELRNAEIFMKIVEQEEKEYEEFQKHKLEIKKQYELTSAEELMNIELEELRIHYENKLLSEEEYQQARQFIIDEYKDLELKKATETAEKELEMKKEKLAQQQAATEAAYNLVAAVKDYELKRAEVRYVKELKAAGDNEEAKQDIQEKYEEEKKRIQKKYAIFELIANIAKIGGSTAEAIMKAVAAFPLTGGLPWTAIIGSTGAVQAGIAIAEYNKVRQMAKGGYADVVGVDDGKTYNAEFIGKGSGGMLPHPSLILAGEQPEYFVNSKMMKHPFVASMLPVFENIRTRQFAEGGATAKLPDVPVTSNEEMVMLLRSINLAVNTWPTIVRAIIDTSGITDIRDAITDQETIENEVTA